MELKQGEQPTAAHVRQLDAAVAAQARLGGPGVLLKRSPWGVATCYRAQGGVGGTSIIFAPSVRRVSGGLLVTWQKGTIEGLPPTVDGAKISDGAAYMVPLSAFNSLGESNVYFRTTYETNWFPKLCEPFASADEPGGAAYQSDRLAMVLYSDGTFWRALYSNQGHLAINRRGATGMAQHLYWGKM